MKKKILIANLAIQLGTNLLCLGIKMQNTIKVGAAPWDEQHNHTSNQLKIITKGVKNNEL